MSVIVLPTVSIAVHTVSSRTEREGSVAGASGLTFGRRKIILRGKNALQFCRYEVLSFYFRGKLKLPPEGKLISSSTFLKFLVV